MAPAKNRKLNLAAPKPLKPFPGTQAPYQLLSKLLQVGYITQRVRVPNNLVLGFWVIVIIIQVLGKYMVISYLDPEVKGLYTGLL